MNPVTVYRVGSLNTTSHSPALERFWNAVDAHKPTTHPVGRTHALYTSPNIYGLDRWTHNMVYNIAETLPVYALTVDADTLYAYHISSYENLERPHLRDGTTPPVENIQAYWSQGSTLSDWLDGRTASPGDDDLEVLVPRSAVLKADPLHIPEIRALLQDILSHDVLDNRFYAPNVISCPCC